MATEKQKTMLADLTLNSWPGISSGPLALPGNFTTFPSSVYSPTFYMTISQPSLSSLSADNFASQLLR